MKFFIRYVLRIETKHISSPLICGSAFHEGKALWYNTHSSKKAVAKVISEIEDNEEFYEYPEQFEKDIMRFSLLLEIWIEKFGKKDLKNYEILGVEEEIIVPIPQAPGFVMSMRPDFVYRDPSDGRIYIHDTKTSSSSKNLTNLSLELGDQATTYLWAVREKYNERPFALIGDIAYWNRSAKREDNIDCYRTDLIIRSDEQIKELQQSCAALFSEISQKVEAWKTNDYHKSELFDRCTYYCHSYARSCEYADICRTDVESRKRVPHGFTRARRSKARNVTSFTKDNITIT